MPRIYITILLILFFTFSSFAQRQSWLIDPAYTSVQFSVEHMGIGNITGYFSIFGGNVTAKNKEFEGAMINFFINSKSLNTENNIRDNKLMSAEFLASSRHPTILFESDQLIKVNREKYRMTGILTIKGIEQTVQFDVDFGGLLRDDEGRTHAGFTLKGSIDRFKFDMMWNELVNDVPIIGKYIEFTINLHLVLDE